MSHQYSKILIVDVQPTNNKKDRTEFKLEYWGMLYDQAGSLVKEPKEQITLEKNAYLLRDFQNISIHALGSGHNVILMSPAGSGKMVVVYLAIRVLQKVNSQCLVGVGTKPLSSIMQESHTILQEAISMRGDVQTSSDCGQQEDDVVLTDLLWNISSRVE